MTAQLSSMSSSGPARPVSPRALGEQQVVLLASGHREQGTSTIAALLGILAATEGERVLLIDAGEGATPLPALLGVDVSSPLPRQGEGTPLLEELVLPVSETLEMLTIGPRGGADDQKSEGERRALLRWVAPLYPRYDLVVIDAGSHLETILTLCDSPVAKLLAVTTCDRIAMTSTYALLKVLQASAPHVPVEVLLNASPAAMALSAYRDLDAATQLFLQRSTEYAGAVPEDTSLRAGTVAGLPVQQAAIDSPVVSAIHQLGARLRGELGNKSIAVSEPRLSHWR